MAEGNQQMIVVPSVKNCQCSRCKLSSVKGKSHPDMHIFENYLEFAQQCLDYQSLVHQEQVPKEEAYLNQILAFDNDRKDQRSLDAVFQSFIKHHSPYVLKDTFDFGIKKSYYATHKKVEGVLRERNIPQEREEDSTLKLIHAYKNQKNRIFIHSRTGRRSPQPISKTCQPRKRTRESTERPDADATISDEPQWNQKVRELATRMLRKTRGSFSPLRQYKKTDDRLPRMQFHNTFMELKRRNLWRHMYVSRLKKSRQKANPHL